MRRWHLMVGLPILISLAVAAPATVSAQETASDTLLTVGHFLDFETVADPQLSPDGSQIIYTRRWVDKVKDRWESALWIMNSDGSKNRFLTEGSNARWSPDGTRIAYLAGDEESVRSSYAGWTRRARHLRSPG